MKGGILEFSMTDQPVDDGVHRVSRVSNWRPRFSRLYLSYPAIEYLTKRPKLLSERSIRTQRSTTQPMAVSLTSNPDFIRSLSIE